MSPAKISTTIHGWVVLDKPLGVTSTQALGRVRRLVNGRKAGHGGTLDPLATGLLPLAFGEATKLIPYVMDGNKEYEFTVRWGESRTTGDMDGEVKETSSIRPTESAIRESLSAFVGQIRQTPPIYSALKIDGVRAYDLARAGKNPDMQPRDVLIDNLELLSVLDRDQAQFRVRCGKGMYVRVLAEDLARKLGTFGHVTFLRRLRVGPFALEQAVSLEKLEELKRVDQVTTALLSLKTAMEDVPVLSLTAGEAEKLRKGQGLLIRAHQSDLVAAKLIFTEHQSVPVALVEPVAGEFRVIRGFSF